MKEKSTYLKTKPVSSTAVQQDFMMKNYWYTCNPKYETNGYSHVKNESVNLRLHNEGKTNIPNIYEKFTETRIYTKFCDSKRLFILMIEKLKFYKFKIKEGYSIRIW